jgi:uroporphyrinogen-III synthase
MHGSVVGGTVVLTASAGSFPGLVERLRQLPVAVEERPLMRFAPPDDWAPLDQALDADGVYSAIAFTSPRAAEAFAARIVERGAERDTERAEHSAARFASGSSPEIWAAGAGTARALAGAISAVRTPSEHEVGRRGAAAALADALLEAGLRARGGRVLFPCGDHRRDELPARLRAGGVEVDEVVCYRSVLAGEGEAREAAERAAVLVVASPSVADLLARACPPEVRPALLAVGPVTAAASRAAGWPAAAVAERPNTEAVAVAARTLLL